MLHLPNQCLKADQSRARSASEVHKQLADIKRLDMLARMINKGARGIDLDSSALEVFRRIPDINAPGMYALITEFAAAKTTAAGKPLTFEVMFELAAKH